MNPVVAFVLQFSWFLVAWAAVATLLVAPALRDLDPDDALAVWVAPHLFRVLGVGLLVENLSPGMPASFAVSTAAGDAITAVLALSSLVSLRRRWRPARRLVLLFNCFGSLDLTVALVHAARSGIAAHLAAQWYVAALGVPLMAVCHVMVFRALAAGGVSRPATRARPAG